MIENRDRKLKPEMNANVEIARMEKDNSIVIQQDIIVDNGDQKYVFVVENGTAKKREIETDGRNGNSVLISKGLNAGDKIIYEGFQSVNDGDKVKIGD